jgi:phosphonate transport system substrate-binding protein
VRTTKFPAALAVALLIASGAVRADGLTIGLIPAESNEEMVLSFEPMRVYLEQRLGEPVRVYTATDYTGIIEAMRKRRIDVAWYGPMSYYLAEREANAEAFVVGVRAGGTATYHSIISVPAGSDAQVLEDLRGRTIALVDPASTSGGLMPAYMVKRATGLMPAEFFARVIWAGTHDAAQLAVKNRTVDSAAGADLIYQRMVAAELISEETNRIIVVSDPLPGAPLAYRGDLEPETKAWLVEAFLDAHNHAEVSGLVGIAYFERAEPADYQVIREMVDELGLSDEQLLD